MSKRPNLLGGIDMAPKSKPVESGPAVPQSRKPAVTRTQKMLPVPDMLDAVPEAEARDGYKVRTRIEKPHVSLYAAPETFDAIKRLALDNRTTAQALYRRGLLLMLQENGLYLDKSEEDV
ncbi:hypothetical protein [Methylobacterium sp. NFXW15]|uniref:hypothetical protein n=1 Tax=Methylobacterium sp. NFXW15 TaxID=2819512 RepID=UPI003CEFBE3C